MRKINYSNLPLKYLSHSNKDIHPAADIRYSPYVEEGYGDPIVLLYGLFGSVRNFNKLVCHLKKDHRVIVPQFPFYDLGCSVDVHRLTDFVGEVVDELELDKFHLLGNSMGGHIALLYALRHPERLSSLILSGSSGLYENGMGDTYPRRRDYNYIKAKTELTFYDPQTASEELVNEIYETVNSRKALQILSLAKSTIQTNLREHLPSIKNNCCIIWGRNDVVTPPEIAEQFHELIPGSRLYWIEECGHVPMMEKPEEFNGVLDGFLESLQV